MSTAISKRVASPGATTGVRTAASVSGLATTSLADTITATFLEMRAHAEERQIEIYLVRT